MSKEKRSVFLRVDIEFEENEFPLVSENDPGLITAGGMIGYLAADIESWMQREMIGNSEGEVQMFGKVTAVAVTGTE